MNTEHTESDMSLRNPGAMWPQMPAVSDYTMLLQQYAELTNNTAKELLQHVSDEELRKNYTTRRDLQLKHFVRALQYRAAVRGLTSMINGTTGGRFFSDILREECNKCAAPLYAFAHITKACSIPTKDTEATDGVPDSDEVHDNLLLHALDRMRKDESALRQTAEKLLTKMINALLAEQAVFMQHDVAIMDYVMKNLLARHADHQQQQRRMIDYLLFPQAQFNPNPVLGPFLSRPFSAQYQASAGLFQPPPFFNPQANVWMRGEAEGQPTRSWWPANTAVRGTANDQPQNEHERQPVDGQ